MNAFTGYIEVAFFSGGNYKKFIRHFPAASYSSEGSRKNFSILIYELLYVGPVLPCFFCV